MPTGPASGLWVLDIDPKHGGAEALDNLILEHGRFADAAAVQNTGGGGNHLAFKWTGAPIKNSAGKVGPGIDVRGEGGYIVLAPSLHISGRRYQWDGIGGAKGPLNLREAPAWLVELVVDRTPKVGTQGQPDAPIPEGSRNAHLTRLAGSMRRPGMSPAAIEAALLEENKLRCNPPLPEAEVRQIAANIGRYEPAEDRAEPQGSDSLSCPQWPDPLAAEAYHGPAGGFVHLVEPHTEADQAAILLQFLTGMGVVFGRSAHFKVEADRHFSNLFVVLVGTTSKSRKGTSWGHVRELIRLLDPQLHDRRIESGLASGEGLVWAVRDAIGDDDPGELDKRLLVVEPEFARVLSVAEREGNTLSAVIRQAWDEGRLRTLTKKQAARSTDAHIAIIGHITKAELKALLSNTAVANGFANRFLWACVRRSKNLPEGGSLAPVAIQAFAVELARVVDFARNLDRLCRDDLAKEVWRSIYDELSEGRPGLLGAVTSRAEAQVLRLSLLYALLDGSATIRTEHIQAALAVWNYCDASAKFIFGDALGDPTADDIRQALRNAEGRGMTRNELMEYFGRHKSSGEIGRALALLAEYGSARREAERTAGRPAERWFYLAR